MDVTGRNCRFTNSLVYYGLSFNTGSLVGSIFLNLFLGGLLELPANIVCFVAMARLGRKATGVCSYGTAALAFIVCIPFLESEGVRLVQNITSSLSKYRYFERFFCGFKLLVAGDGFHDGRSFCNRRNVQPDVRLHSRTVSHSRATPGGGKFEHDVASGRVGSAVCWQ